jgi:DNA polymerase I-like protein with 3'-5' exonuclease and polymerase domains
MEALVAMLEDPAVEKVGQNLKYDLLVLRRCGVTMRGIAFDSMIASYLLDPGRREHGLDSLALEHFDHRTTAYSDVAGKGKSEIPFAEVPLATACGYACEDADIALRLCSKFEPQLEELKLDRLFREIEIPLIEVLAEMEWQGIAIDDRFFADLSLRLRDDLARLEREIHEEAGVEFNINSNPQLREILFDRLELPVVKRTKTGPSTDATVLERLAADGHRLPELLLEYRQLEKLRSTYVSALPRMVNPDTHRIHTSFNQTVAATGRLSSSDPNLQNIPIRTEVGREIRRGFVPAEGYRFLAADYSQIELRILAHYSEDPAFVDAFQAGEDIHRQTAAIVFGVDLAGVTREMRDRAKTVNFATLYGQGDFSLGQQLGISREEAKEFIRTYFERFPGVRAYLDRQIELAKEQGYVETITGRRRYIPEIKSRNFNIRAFGERAATNAPIQGSSADLIKMAMIRIHHDLQAGDLGARMLVQVHDELLFEVPEDRLEEATAFVRERMEGVAELKVPLVVRQGKAPPGSNVNSGCRGFARALRRTSDSARPSLRLCARCVAMLRLSRLASSSLIRTNLASLGIAVCRLPSPLAGEGAGGEGVPDSDITLDWAHARPPPLPSWERGTEGVRASAPQTLANAAPRPTCSAPRHPQLLPRRNPSCISSVSRRYREKPPRWSHDLRPHLPSRHPVPGTPVIAPPPRLRGDRPDRRAGLRSDRRGGHAGPAHHLQLDELLHLPRRAHGVRVRARPCLRRGA